MNRSPRACSTATSSLHCFHGFSKFADFGHAYKLFVGGHELLLPKKELRCVKLVVAAELPKRPFSLNFGLDSQTFEAYDVSQLCWMGPVPGDIAEIEAYCRIFRAAEYLHTTLMDTLCDPETGVCTVSYDFSSEVLEDKIVTVLGWLMSIVNKGRQDVLSGRSSSMTFFRMENANMLDEKLPPLATFRSEIKRCCESLHVALENYIVPGENRGDDVWRKLQRLKNLCYDLGFPRGEDSPSHMLFANWTPVPISAAKKDAAPTDSGIAFFKGGQVTEEGLNWLMAKGFRTIVDLRGEIVKDNFYQAALDDAISSGKIELFKFPVDIGTAPSMEQVEKFASLVSDPSRMPLFLHSKEGIWRTSAMVSRWRQYVSRYESLGSNNSISPNRTLSMGTNGSSLVNIPSNRVTQRHLQNRHSRLADMADDKSTSEVLDNPPSGMNTKRDQGNKEAYGGDLKQSDSEPLNEVNESRLQSSTNANINPFRSQFPPSDVFSRKEMSSFLRNRKNSPNTIVDSEHRVSEVVPSLKDECSCTTDQQVKMDTVSVLMETGNSNGSSHSKDNFLRGQQATVGNGATLGGKMDTSGGKLLNEEKHPVMMNYVSSSMTDKNLDEDISEIVVPGRRNDACLSVNPGDSDSEVIEGDMCASATGVVRLQSRRKAEMFLVRTDGFSCTREKVTESSLAFTHPSTQQQMLMWKSKPKTVLLLKKLGQELMEEAQEVASFLYYQEKMNVLVEPDVHDIFARMPGFGFVQTFYGQDSSDLHEKVDFVACLGGDGVILHASNLFRGPVPPVVSFNLGSLGFLTSHNFEDYKEDLRQVIHGNSIQDGVYITLRMRLRCQIFRNGKAMPGKVFDVLNEVVVDRGSNPYISKIECYEHDHLITKVGYFFIVALNYVLLAKTSFGKLLVA
ncbi:hypothetical protein Cgig2_027860 [Carnegiea gigantea]|uniref:DSP-PTPase phosphatase fused to NAD+ Kinase domain-containing protein n=1 Tax=Carnegiea gigantea TaxID=171969 RepID=A0A9Q1GNU6_9CARY|nr:hypothetical protein Cgig2_027860 [Carnegiea gigantea]